MQNLAKVLPKSTALKNSFEIPSRTLILVPNKSIPIGQYMSPDQIWYIYKIYIPYIYIKYNPGYHHLPLFNYGWRLICFKIQQKIFVQLQEFAFIFKKNIHSTSTNLFIFKKNIQHKYSFNFNKNIYSYST